MKSSLFAIAVAVSLSACAGTRVSQTQVASSAIHPKAIYIRPFAAGDFRGDHEGSGMKAIHQAQSSVEFAKILKEELEKIAPTCVLAEGEYAPDGWLVEGELTVVDGGSPALRASPFGVFGAGRSGILIHVQVTDVNGDASRDGKGGAGNTLYEFDVSGGSRLTGHAGSVSAPGLGYSAPFDYRNAAERIGKALNPDYERYGARSSASIR